MFVYANCFRGAIDSSRSEFALEFLQNTPVFGENSEIGTVKGTRDEVVASIVMNADGIITLRDMLNKALEDMPDDNTITDIVD